MKTNNGAPPPQAPIVKKTGGMAQLLKRDKRQGSSSFNISKNRELQKLPLIKGKQYKISYYANMSLFHALQNHFF